MHRLSRPAKAADEGPQAAEIFACEQREEAGLFSACSGAGSTTSKTRG